VDTQGLLLGVVVQAADIQDAGGLWGLLKRLKPLYPWLRAVFADSIYNRLTALLACFLFGLTLIIVRRVAGSRGFVDGWSRDRSAGSAAGGVCPRTTRSYPRSRKPWSPWP
jgi:putative transposase